jgi:hypothetical protein
MASPAYSREYREWLAEGNFERVYGYGRKSIVDGLESKLPHLVASGLEYVSCCYYTRGAVALLEGNSQGWRDIQCGYLAKSYSIRFVIPLQSGILASVKDSPDNLVETVMTLALAQLFRLSFDETFLREWLTPRYDRQKLTSKVNSGGLILDSVYLHSHSIAESDLKRDRKECCQKRDAYPKRPTEIRPFGTLDVEMAINYPESAEFGYPTIDYSPTEDELVIEGITAYHQWHES